MLNRMPEFPHHGGGDRGVTGRAPPSWNPANAAHQPFREWARDLMIWSALSDLRPHQKAAAVILNLRGSAQVMARQLPPEAIMTGGLVNGQQVDPMTYLMHALAERYSPLGEV